MSGARRKTKYRKNVTSEYLNELPLPDGEKGEEVVVMVRSHGSNILEIRTASGEISLCRLPTKFRRLIWVKKGDFMIVSGSTEEYETAAGSKGRVNFQVERILSADQVKHIAKQGLWPDAFAHALGGRAGAGSGEGSGAAGAAGAAAAAAAGATAAAAGGSKVVGAGGKGVAGGLVGAQAEGEMAKGGAALTAATAGGATAGEGTRDSSSASASASACASSSAITEAGGLDKEEQEEEEEEDPMAGVFVNNNRKTVVMEYDDDDDDDDSSDDDDD